MMFTDDNHHLVAEFRKKSGRSGLFGGSRVAPQVFVFDCMHRPSYLLVGPLNERRTWMIGPDEVRDAAQHSAFYCPVAPDGNSIVVGSEPDAWGHVMLEVFALSPFSAELLISRPPLTVAFGDRPMFGYPRNTAGISLEDQGRVVAMQGLPQEPQGSAGGSGGVLESLRESGIPAPGHSGCLWRYSAGQVAYDVREGELEAAAQLAVTGQHDYYLCMFTCDLAAYVAAAMWAAVGVPVSTDPLSTGDQTEGLSLLFTVTVILQFAFIVADRVIYLFSYNRGKQVFNALLVVFYLVVAQYAVFFTGKFNDSKGSWSPMFNSFGHNCISCFILFKSGYLCFSALQAQSGYPVHHSPVNRTKGNALLRLARDAAGNELPPTLGQYCVYMLYYSVPFLYELRTYLDWTCTATTLVFYQWLKVEDIFSQLFIQHYTAYARAPTTIERRFGYPLPHSTKVLSGACIFGLLCVVIWSPLIIFAPGTIPLLDNPVVSTRLQIGLVAGRNTYGLYDTAMARPCECPRDSEGDLEVPARLEASFASMKEGAFVDNVQDYCQLASFPQQSRYLWSAPLTGIEALSRDLADPALGANLTATVSFTSSLSCIVLPRLYH